MPFIKFGLKVQVIVLVLSVLACTSFDVFAQRKSKRTRRTPATSENRSTTESTEPKIVGSSTDTSAATNNNQNADVLRETVDRLSSQVTVLTEKLKQMETTQRSEADLERLSRAEQRADALREQLGQLIEKESNLKMRLEQLNYEMLPDNIERRGALNGSLRPELMREQIRRQLEIERQSIQSQLDHISTMRSRLENSIMTADMEILRIKARLDDTGNSGVTATVPQTTTVTPVTPTPTTTTPNTIPGIPGPDTSLMPSPTTTPTTTPYGSPQ
jgi:chromosome segregation ATPase